ncbi:MAG: hypothetical protein MUF07_09950 [Steroidobacteraceae bacterium]|jgi:hypothetical protein|nr:hypothetical protein [Steroidobacteraceae bacterium]
MSATVRAAPTGDRRYRIHKTRIEVPGVDPRVDTLLGMVMQLMSEVSVLRERVDAHERLAAAQQAPTPDAVDDYVPDEAASRARAAVRQRMIEKVCRPLLAADEAAEAKQKANGQDRDA